MYGTIFPTFAKCRSHACGFTGVRSYTDQDMSSLSDPFTAKTSLLLLLFRKSKNYTLTSKHRKIIIITTSEQYFFFPFFLFFFFFFLQSKVSVSGYHVHIVWCAVQRNHSDYPVDLMIRIISYFLLQIEDGEGWRRMEIRGGSWFASHSRFISGRGLKPWRLFTRVGIWFWRQCWLSKFGRCNNTSYYGTI